jgi:phosphogluconate dehydratase
MNTKVNLVTQRIIERSKESRVNYLNQMLEQFSSTRKRSQLSCGNLAHGFAGCNKTDKSIISDNSSPNIGIVTAYNDMLSAHKTYENYPDKLRVYANKFNSSAQVAGGVPAMCDGITQGQQGMELSLFSRDVIALSTALALSHNMFDGALCLGICDKIVPGLLIGSLKFGYLPIAFVPGGPMTSGISNEEKAKIRQEFAEGKIDRQELLKGESDSYHSPGTCTFYGTANSNQMLLEIMGLQLPGSSFVNPDTELRELLNEEIVRTIVHASNHSTFDHALASIVSEKTIVNAIVGLLATGGSTNHTIHLIAIAKAAGIIINWEDFSDLSDVVPLLVRVYPNGAADINHFHAAGGMGFLIKTLLDNGFLHSDVQTIIGYGLDNYTKEPKVINQQLVWEQGANSPLNDTILRTVDQPFQPEGGIKLLTGNIGRAIIKTSAVALEHLIIKAPAIVFKEQSDLITAFKQGKLDKDFIAVLPFQGPKQNGMPELHQLTPTLTILQKRGFKVALVTDGRMSGASGKVPAAIHMVPEAKEGGNIAKIETGDMLILDGVNGTLTCSSNLDERQAKQKIGAVNFGSGIELFARMRQNVNSSEEGASFL